MTLLGIKHLWCFPCDRASATVIFVKEGRMPITGTSHSSIPSESHYWKILLLLCLIFCLCITRIYKWQFRANPNTICLLWNCICSISHIIAYECNAMPGMQNGLRCCQPFWMQINNKSAHMQILFVREWAKGRDRTRSTATNRFMYLFVWNILFPCILEYQHIAYSKRPSRYFIFTCDIWHIWCCH